jgi:hypothetical protein
MFVFTHIFEHIFDEHQIMIQNIFEKITHIYAYVYLYVCETKDQNYHEEPYRATELTLHHDRHVACPWLLSSSSTTQQQRLKCLGATVT